MPAARSRRHRLRRPGRLLLVAALATAALAGCSGSDEDVPYTGTMLTSTPQTRPLEGGPSTTAPPPPGTRPGGAPDPAADGVARILFVGDSLTHGALPTLKARFENAGAQVGYVGAPGTGILSGTSWWVAELGGQLRSFAPDVVVFEDCCNYDGGDAGYTLADGSVVHENTDEMYTAWRAAAEGAIALARAAGAKVHWVVTPAIGDRPDPVRERVDRYNEITAELDVDLIDWREVLTPDGTFELEIDVDGRPTQVRNEDELHLVDAGNVLVTEVTWKAVAGELGLA